MSADLLWAILTSSLVATITSQVFGFIKALKRYKRRDKIILFYIIKELAVDAIFARHVSNDDLKILEDAYAEYKAMGGNGYADTLLDRVRALPLWGDDDEVRAELHESHR